MRPNSQTQLPYNCLRPFFSFLFEMSIFASSFVSLPFLSLYEEEEYLVRRTFFPYG